MLAEAVVVARAAEAERATRPRARAKLQLQLRDPPGPLMISRFVFATTARLAARRRISATSRTLASYVSLSTQPISARLELKTPKASVLPDQRCRYGKSRGVS